MSDIFFLALSCFLTWRVGMEEIERGGGASSKARAFRCTGVLQRSASRTGGEDRGGGERTRNGANLAGITSPSRTPSPPGTDNQRLKVVYYDHINGSGSGCLMRAMDEDALIRGSRSWT